MPIDLDHLETLESVLSTVLNATTALAAAIKQLDEEMATVIDDNRRLRKYNDELSLALVQSRNRLNRLLDTNKVIIRPNPDTLPASRHNQDIRTVFSVRVGNALYRSGIETLAELVTLTDDKILQCRNMGQKGLIEIKQTLQTLQTQS